MEMLYFLFTVAITHRVPVISYRPFGSLNVEKELRVLAAVKTQKSVDTIYFSAEAENYAS